MLRPVHSVAAMDVYSALLTGTSQLLAATLLFRAARGKFLSHFPFFYSYITYILASGLVVLTFLHYRPQTYPTVYWFRFLISLVAEFVVLVEVSDHIFGPYPAIRRLGRFLAVAFSGVFFSLYILPSLWQHRPSSMILLEFAKRASLTKAAIICALLGAARYYRLSLGRNVSGILLGFGFYLGVSVANFTAASEFGKALYADFLRVSFPFSYTVCSLVWLIALWGYEPIPQVAGIAGPNRRGTSTASGHQLARFNNVLARFLGK